MPPRHVCTHRRQQPCFSEGTGTGCRESVHAQGELGIPWGAKHSTTGPPQRAAGAWDLLLHTRSPGLPLDEFSGLVFGHTPRDSA